MEVTYRRNAGKSYMVIQAEGHYSEYEMEMYKRNRLQGFLRFETVVADGKLEFWYDITGRISLEEHVRYHKLESRELFHLIKGIEGAQNTVENYLLKEQSIRLVPTYIFVGNGGREISFCYCPGSEDEFPKQFRALMEYLLVYVDHGEEYAVKISYRIYQMTMEPNFGIQEIREIIQEMEESYERNKYRIKGSEPSGTTYMESESLEECVEEESSYGIGQQKKEYLGKWVAQGKKIVEEKTQRWIRRIAKDRGSRNQMVFEPTEIRGAETENQTVFLGKNKEEHKMVKLTYMGENEGADVELVEDIYCVGSQEDADIVIRDKTVSRLHARINKSEGKYYIEDMNSRNGTWINGKMLHYLEKVALKNGDVVAFSDIRYKYEESV